MKDESDNSSSRAAPSSFPIFSPTLNVNERHHEARLMMEISFQTLVVLALIIPMSLIFLTKDDHSLV